MKKSTRFSPEVRERAVRMVVEVTGQHDSQWAAIVSIAARIGCTAETLRGWVPAGKGAPALGWSTGVFWPGRAHAGRRQARRLA